MVSEVPEFCLRWNNHHSVLVSVLDSLLERETLVDVMLAAEGQFIKVHRLVLCACSQYFEDLLSQQSDKQAVVFLKDVRFVDLKALVDYMYRGEVNVCQDQLAAFLSTAESLRIKGLADKDDSKKSVPAQLPERPASRKRSREKKASSIITAEQSIPETPPPVAAPLLPDQLGEPRCESPLQVLESPSPPSSPQPQTEDNSMQEEASVHAEIDSDDHFIAVEPKLECDTEADMSVDHLESTDNWSAKEVEEDWSNSEALSVASPSDASNANPPTLGQENWTADNAASSSGKKSTSKSSSVTSRGSSKVSKGSKGSTSSLTCPTCGKAYTNKRNFMRHKRYECGFIPPSFTCCVCHLRFRRRDNMKAHQLRQHHDMPFLFSAD